MGSDRTLPETALYPPVKRLLEAQGYCVKGEIGALDVMAVRGDEPPVIVELKLGFSLTLFHQATARLAVSDAVYVAVLEGKGRRWTQSLKSNRTLCRRLGLGLILVRPDDLVRPEGASLPGHAQVVVDPGSYQPRKNAARRGHLLREFARREGDPCAGGLPSTAGRMTSYRQDALRLARHLATAGPSKGAHVAAATGVTRATRMMADDHYGWFERVSPGIYTLTARGRQALSTAP
ncbi:MAG: DUF2161 family putative PD-(D/E)XK-type phosphodiesterase [Pseudomonadota bacterium]